MTPGCPLPRCHCPCALCCSCPVGPPAPYHEVPFGTRPLPSPVRVNPHIPQALPAGNCYPGPDCQFGPVRTHVQHGLQQLWWLQARPQMSPSWVGVAGNAEPSREQLCLDPCASSPGYPLSPRCWHRAGGGGCSLCPLPVHPCPLSPSPGAGAVCAPPVIPGTVELLDCWKLSRKEALFPLGLPGGTFTSGRCHGGHLPGTNTSRCVDYFS